MSLRIVSSNVAFKTAAPLSRIAPSALLMQRRSAEYWGMTVTGRTQPFAQGDMLPRTHNVLSGKKEAMKDSAALTGSAHNRVYDSNTMFDVDAQLGVDREFNLSHNGASAWKVNAIGEGDAQRVTAVLDELITQPKKQEEYFWARLLKDFPALSKPLDSESRARILDFYRSAAAVADTEAAVTALAKPFVEKMLTGSFITPHTWWRISEKLCDAVELITSERNRYERRASRNVVERVTKIALNTMNQHNWVHPDAMDPLQMEVGGFRGWHDAGNW